jgi:hypothetical protein
VDAAKKVAKLFAELIDEGETIRQACKKLYFSGQKKSISPELFTEWKTKCLSLLKSTFGSSSPQYDTFVNAKFFDYYNATQVFLGILRAASQDVQKGYFFHKDLMLSVNIYDSLLSRAQKYLQEGEQSKAQAVLETVLQEVLGKICANKKIPCEQDESIDVLANTLYRAEAISDPVKKELQMLNNKFNQPDASPLSRAELSTAAEWILSFLDEYLGGQILILN